MWNCADFNDGCNDIALIYLICTVSLDILVKFPWFPLNIIFPWEMYVFHMLLGIVFSCILFIAYITMTLTLFSCPWCVFWTKLAWVWSGYLHTIYWELSLQRHVSIRYKSSQCGNSFNKIYWVTVPLANITTSVPSFPLKVIFFDRCSFSLHVS